MNPLPYRFVDPVQALQVLNLYGYIELFSDRNQFIQVHLSPMGPVSSYNYGLPSDIFDIHAFLQQYFNTGFRQRYKRSMPLRRFTAYGDPGVVLGSGTYGSVTEYRRSTPLTIPGYRSTDRFAVKTIANANRLIGATTFREISSLECLIHPNIIELIDVNITPDAIFLVMPLALGTLPYRGVPPQFRADWFGPNFLKFYIYQLVRGLAYMHMLDVWHRDIKPENILVFSHNNLDGYILKYADFGLSRNVICPGILDLSISPVYSLWYRPPEVLLGGSVRRSSDVWALAITILRLILQRDLVAGNTEAEQLELIFNFVGAPGPTSSFRQYPQWTSSFPNPAQPEFLSARFRQNFDAIPDGHLLYPMIASMLRLEPENRADVINLVNSTYFDTIRSQVDNDPIFWAPRPLPMTCLDVLLSFESYPQLILSSHSRTDRASIILLIFRLWQQFHLFVKTFFTAIMFLDWYLDQTTPLIDSMVLATACLMIADDMIQFRVSVGPNYLGATGLDWDQLTRAEHHVFRFIVNYLVSVTSYDFYRLDKVQFSSQVQSLSLYILIVLILTALPLQYGPSRISEFALGLAANLYQQSIPQDFNLPYDNIREELRALGPNEITALMEQRTNISLDTLIASF